MKHIYVHIGTAKTGTSSLQAHLVGLRDELLEAGVLYPTAGRLQRGPVNGHHLLPWSIQKKRGVKDETAWQELVWEIESSDAKTVVLTSEELFHFRNPHIQRMREYLEPYQVTVVVYLRNPWDFVFAAYKEVVKKGGFRDDLDAFIRSRAGLARYGERLDVWSSVFGREAIAVRVYERCKSQPGGTIKDFTGLLELTGDAFEPTSRRPRRNISPGDDIVSMIRTLNRLQARLATVESLEPRFRKARQYLIRNDRKDKKLISIGRRLIRKPLFSEGDKSLLRELVRTDLETLSDYIEADDVECFVF